MTRLSRHILHTKEFFNKIRERLKVTEEQLPDKQLRAYYKYLNVSLLDFILDNPEGFQMTIGNQFNGVLAVSKHLPKEMRENKFEKLEEIDTFSHIPEWRKKILRKRYDTSLTRRFALEARNKDNPNYHINPHTFFYTYRFMWFNHRNCKIKKTKAYMFEVSKYAKAKIEEKVRQGQEYHELNFNDFYKFRIKPIN